MNTSMSVGLVALLAALTVEPARTAADPSPSVAVPPGPTAAPATPQPAPSQPPKDAAPAPPNSAQPAQPAQPSAADKTKPSTNATKPADAEKPKPQKEAGWYTGGIYSFNLLNVEYYNLNTRDLHFSGQRRDIDSDWAGLADLLTKSKAMGFVEINRKFVNLRNLSAIHDLGGSRGATLTFRDGATLKISASELERLIEVTK